MARMRKISRSARKVGAAKGVRKTASARTIKKAIPRKR